MAIQFTIIILQTDGNSIQLKQMGAIAENSTINIVNDWIYYYSCSSEKWFKIKIDGSEKTVLSVY